MESHKIPWFQTTNSSYHRSVVPSGWSIPMNFMESCLGYHYIFCVKWVVGRLKGWVYHPSFLLLVLKSCLHQLISHKQILPINIPQNNPWFMANISHVASCLTMARITCHPAPRPHPARDHPNARSPRTRCFWVNGQPGALNRYMGLSQNSFAQNSLD